MYLSASGYVNPLKLNLQIQTHRVWLHKIVVGCAVMQFDVWAAKLSYVGCDLQ